MSRRAGKPERHLHRVAQRYTDRKLSSTTASAQARTSASSMLNAIVGRILYRRAFSVPIVRLESRLVRKGGPVRYAPS